MKTYWINECVVTPEGKLLPRGFELHIGETARIVVPSDVPGDKESLYEEEIPLSQKIFIATYDNGVPVHIEDGKIIGEEKKRAEQKGCQVYVYGNYLPYLVEEGRNSYLDDSAPIEVIGGAKLLDIDEDRAVFEIEGEVTVQWLDGLRQVEHEEGFRF